MKYVDIVCQPLGINDRIEGGNSQLQVRQEYELPAPKAVYEFTLIACDMMGNTTQATTTITVDEMPDFEKMYMAAVWESDKTDRTLIVGISVKNSIPAYILRNYSLRYQDASGHTKTITLPEMHPGQRYDIAVTNINDQVKFDICRPDGRACLNY